MVPDQIGLGIRMAYWDAESENGAEGQSCHEVVKSAKGGGGFDFETGGSPDSYVGSGFHEEPSSPSKTPQFCATL